MTTLREAAQQALEALEEYQSKGPPFWACDAAVASLRAALALPDRTGSQHCERMCEAEAFKIEIRRLRGTCNDFLDQITALRAALAQEKHTLTDLLTE